MMDKEQEKTEGERILIKKRDFFRQKKRRRKRKKSLKPLRKKRKKRIPITAHLSP